MKNNMYVRKVLIGDLEVLSKIYADAFEKEINESIKYNGENIYVVCLESDVVGMCIVDYMDDIFANKRTAYINAVCISKDYRGRGLASFLLNEVERKVKKEGAREMMLTCSSKRVCASGLYKKLGFEIFDTNVFKKKI